MIKSNKTKIQVVNIIIIAMLILPQVLFIYNLFFSESNKASTNNELIKTSEYAEGSVGYDMIVGGAAYYSSGSTIYWDFINLNNVDIRVLAMTGSQFGDAIMGERPVQYHSLLMEGDMGYGYFTVPSTGQWAIGFYHRDSSHGNTEIYFNVGGPSPYVRITRPSSAENWVKKDMVYRIEWTNCYVANAKLELWKGSSYLNDISPYLIRDGFYPTYDWHVLSSLVEDNNYRIRIINRVNPNIYDFSDYFEIYEDDLINCIQPTSSSKFGTETSQDIQWTWRGYLSNLDIELWNETDVISQITSSTECDGLYSWEIPYNISEGSNYRIKIFDHDNPSLYNFSDSFTIFDASPPKIMIQEPNNYSITSQSPPLFNIEILEQNLDRVEYQLQNDSISTDFYSWEGQIEQSVWEQIGNGTLQFTLFANDTNGNNEHTSLILYKDIKSPVININEPTPNKICGILAPQVSVEIVDAYLDKIWYQLQNGSFSTEFYSWEGQIEQSVWEQIGNGTVQFTLFANDTIGNEAFKEILIFKDTIPPEWIGEPENQFIEYGDDLYYDLDAFDISSISHWWINDTFLFDINENGEISTPITLSVGEYWLGIGVCDIVENYCNSTIKITVQDTTSPIWMIEPEDRLIQYGEDFNYNLEAFDLSGISYWWINDTINFHINNNGKITNLIALEEGVYSVEIRAYDVFDNYCSKTIRITVERANPPPSGIIPGYNELFILGILSGISILLISFKFRKLDLI